MLKIITHNVKSNVIRDAESFFVKYIVSEKLDSLSLSAMKEIDLAVILDKKLGTIQTRFGITDIYHLSTGCKIVLVYLYMWKHKDQFKDWVLEITECGGNALKVLFDCNDKLGDDDSVFLLRQSTQLIDFRHIPAVVNGNPCDSLYEGMILYGE